MVYILRTGKKLTVIDTGSGRSVGPAVYSYVEKNLPESPKQIKNIFLTHWHGDHAGGALELKRLTGAQIICHQADAGYLSGKDKIEACMGKRMPTAGLKPGLRVLCGIGYIGLGADTSPVRPDKVVAEGPADFAPGWEVIDLPGHTPGSCGLWSPKEKILFPGDTLLAVGQQLIPPLPFLIQQGDFMINSWQKISELGPINWLLPGHFNILKLEDQVTVSPKWIKRANKASNRN
ncbi:MAG: MBL fold metallo-hydrolase [Chitinophagales bacterium]